ncbi:FecR domain-containing protein [candidate division WOR-3 bacterium]|nr:FecR domain-containing protein [candidate division WOR-3 bacterium]
MKILKGDSLVTEDDSYLEIRYEDGSVSSLEPNSTIMINEIKKEKGLFTTRIKSLVGSLLCKIKKLKKGESFQVYTPTAAATVRGTVFEVVVKETQETSFNVLSGQLYAKALIEGAQTYLLRDKFTYFVGKEGIPDVRKLTDNELAALRNRAHAYIRDFIEEKKEEIEKGTKKGRKKGCLGFI